MRHALTIVTLCLVACGADHSALVDPAPTVEPASAPATDIAPAASLAADTIDADDIMPVVREIAHDSYGGRGPGTEGDSRTRQWLAGRLADLGYVGAAPDGGYDQTFDLVGIDAAQPAVWRFDAGDQVLELASLEEFVAASGVQSGQATVADAELVFVGYGIQAPEHDWDDFKGMDLTGKVLVMLNNDPDWDPDLFAGERRLYYGRWTYKYESAARQGAAGAVIIHTDTSAGYGWQVVQTSWTGPQFELPAGDEPRLQVSGWLTAAAAGRLLQAAGQDLKTLTAAARSRQFAPVPLGVTTSITLANRLSRVRSGNVLGMLPGSDPVLADEVVVYTAHHDHLGTNPSAVAGEDAIYNGARDNATGTGMVLAIAGAFASLPQPPRRSILIAFVGAEEQGLLGSKHLATHPPVAPGRLAANINFDSGNIWGRTTDITYVGMNKSTLDEVARRVAGWQGRTVVPDQSPDKGFFYRSDQFNLARIGVPALYLKVGSQFIGRPEGWGDAAVSAHSRQHYHQPSDEITGDWDPSGMVVDARFGFMAGWLIAQADGMPSWYPGDEFEAARLQALGEAVTQDTSVAPQK